MLRWTAAGAVAGPRTVQIRVTCRYPGRVRAGAPVPTRSLTPGELLANLRYFTEELRGPRTRSCDAVVLSGLELAAWPDLPAALAQARSWGVERVTLHLARPDLGDLSGVDAVALTVRAGQADAVAALRERAHVTAVALLDAENLADPVALCRALVRAAPHRVVLTWPLPPADPPPAVDAVLPALRALLGPLDAAGIPAGVKGLPVCSLAELGGRLWRSANRWYVDAEHQRGRALLFFPDVVRFHKADVCRFCAADARCDGVPGAWVAAGRVGPLSPL